MARSRPDRLINVTTELSPVMQDYVKVLSAATEWSRQPVTTSVLATRLGVTAPSVSEMVGRLAAAGLVEREPYGEITLTDEGNRLGRGMLRRHRLIESYLVDELDYTWDEVHEEAEVLEHAISDLMLDRIDARLGHPLRDPHGDPIPRTDGSIVLPSAVPMTDLGPGSGGRVARIADDDSALLRYLEELGVRLDLSLDVVERRPYGAGTVVRRHDHTRPGEPTAPGEKTESGELIVLGDEALGAIWVTPEPAQG